ncbi:MAG: alpha-mannosidase [Aristaeellaceae bacterium]
MPMNIGRQWEDRLRIWGEALEARYIAHRIPLQVSCFTTMDHLPLETAAQGPFQPAPDGTRWGRKWEYGWFRARAEVPAALAGLRLTLSLGVGEEMLVWVNGQEAGAIDRKHHHITLTRCARAGEVFDILAECYAGHGPRMEGAGPAAPDEVTVPEPPEHQQTVRPSFLCVWNEPVFQASMDYQTLYSLVKRLPEKSLRAMKIIEGLKRFTLEADFELPLTDMTRSVSEAARRHLHPLLQCRNGSTAPEYTVFGQSHLDMAWLWPVEETMRKSARTYANQLALMDEYPEYRFLMCEPPILEYLRALYPQVFRRVMDKAAQGAFLPEGAMWIESDTNIPSGESLIRQIVRGKRWFRENLGADSRMAWMPDTFGFTAALPQILRKCQVPYFATQKLLRQDPEAEPFPCNVFWWEGLDGSRVLSHIFKKNNAALNAGDLIARWEDDRIQQEGIDGLMYPFGYGDGGGGPTREMLEIARRCADLEGAPRLRMESPVRFFERQGQVDNVYCGELYLAWHRGTLTAQAKTKRGIRRAEVTLKQAEYLMARRLLAGKPIAPLWQETLDQCWQKLLFNQFHDVAAGASIARVHARAEEELEQAIRGGEGLIRAMAGDPGETPALYNHLSWPRVWRGQVIPAQGFAAAGHPAPREKALCTPAEDGFVLRNAHLVCRISGRGEALSVRRPGDDREYLSGPGNRLMMFRDVNTCYDAWELASMTDQAPVPLEEPVQLSVMAREDGVSLLLERQLHHSRLRQEIFLGDDAQRLDFVTHVTWRERHKLLKVSFPVNVLSREALQEIQFGYLPRPTHRSTRHDRDRYEVCNHRYTVLRDGSGGAAVLNDGKYGVSVEGSDIRLSLLRAPLMPDMTADQGEQDFTYAFMPFAGPFEQSRVLREAVELNEPPIPGSIAAVDELPVFLPEKANVIADTVKVADAHPGALLVRVYEAMGMATDTAVALHPSIAAATETDMLEENSRPLPVEGGLRLHFGAFEIKTILLHIAQKECTP